MIDPENPSLNNPACQYLGTQRDPASMIGRASARNFCHHCKVPVVPLLAHQSEFCLMDKFSQCPIYTGSGLEPFPAELRSHFGSEPFYKRLTFDMLINGLKKIVGK